MKTKFLVYGVLILIFVAGNTAVAQVKTGKTRTRSTSYTINNDASGKAQENVTTTIDNTEYKMELVNEKMTGFYVDGKLIPAEQYSQYETVIVKIKEQMRLDKIQAKKDQEQAKLDQAQANKDQHQAKLDQEQAIKDQAAAKLDMEKANKDQHQAKLDQEQANKDQHQAKLDQERANEDKLNAKLDMERAEKDQHQAKLDQEQANKDQVQAKLDQEQAIKDQAQAKIDQKQAEEDQKLMKQLVSDLIKDGIVPDEKSLLSVTLSSTGMTVNDKKQADEVYRKYKEKYSRFATGNFSYGNMQNGNKSIHMHRPSK